MCPSCGTSNGPDARFCRRCGTAVATDLVRDAPAGDAAAARPVPRPLPDGERRQLTVMFCDLVDSVGLGQRIDPEDLHEVVRAYQALCDRIVRHHAGHIARYIGDGLLVYFGYPLAHEDDPARAVQAGLDIVGEIDDLNAELERTRGLRLAIRIGIHSGLVVIGECGGDPREAQVLGHTVNLAARLQGVAEPNTVVISAATRGLVHGRFATRDLGPQALKGIEGPVAAHRVVGVTNARSRLDVAAVEGLTPFVGREHEIALVLDRWEEARDGHGQAVLLAGEGGIGKSRLVRVLRDRLAGQSVSWLETQCSPYHVHSAFRPLVELLEQSLGLQRDAPPAERLEMLRREVDDAGLPTAEAVPLFAGLLSLRLPDSYAAAGGNAEVQRRRTVELLCAWLLARGGKGAKVLVVEDLHWVDPSTKEFLGALIEQVPAAPVLLLLTARPMPQPLWRDRSNLTPITLHPLSRQQVGAMVERIAGGARLPADVRRQVVAKTDGVPLFVEELTKAVLESGLLRAEGTGLEFAIPSTLHDSLMARLDRLGPSKDLAQVAAVLGREFPHDLLAAVSPLDAVALDRALRDLVRAELIYPRGVPPHASYRFKHALVQETAYQSLLRSHRQEVHARVARVLAQRFPERAAGDPEEMAHHCLEGGLSVEAASWYRQAGERAAERCAHTEALAHFSRALDIAATLPAGPDRDRLELILRVAAGPPMIAIRGYGDPEVEQTFERARRLCESVDEAPNLFEAVWGLANYYQSRSALGPARVLGEQLVTMAERGLEVHQLVWAHLQLGATLFWLGEPVAALAHYDEAIARHVPGARRLLTGATDPGAAARVYAGLALWQLGRCDMALAMSRAGVAAGRACGDAFSLALALCFAGILHRLRREPDLVRARADEAIALSTEQEFPLWRGLGHMLRGWATTASGTGAEGLEEIQQGLAQLASIGTEVGASGGLALLADARRMAGQVEAALEQPTPGWPSPRCATSTPGTPSCTACAATSCCWPAPATTRRRRAASARRWRCHAARARRCSSCAPRRAWDGCCRADGRNATRGSCSPTPRRASPRVRISSTCARRGRCSTRGRREPRARFRCAPPRRSRGAAAGSRRARRRARAAQGGRTAERPARRPPSLDRAPVRQHHAAGDERLRRQLGHQTSYATYYGQADPASLLPADLDAVFISTYTSASPLAYALARLYRRGAR
ncbi:MAG: adenylate/guanylate cyclase domain-containing protein [Candidatus Binatia bacterium]